MLSQHKLRQVEWDLLDQAYTDLDAEITTILGSGRVVTAKMRSAIKGLRSQRYRIRAKFKRVKRPLTNP
jgi:hypothetical protein